jgi:hypothetical protein
VFGDKKKVANELAGEMAIALRMHTRVGGISPVVVTPTSPSRVALTVWRSPATQLQTEAAVALTAATAKTILGVATPAQFGCDLHGIWIAFDGSPLRTSRC